MQKSIHTSFILVHAKHNLAHIYSIVIRFYILRSSSTSISFYFDQILFLISQS